MEEVEEATVDLAVHRVGTVKQGGTEEMAQAKEARTDCFPSHTHL